MPLVSIVTPMHNASAYITNTIQSVLLQTFTDWEMIIVDDLSTDDSVKIVENYLNDPRIKLIQQKVNSGPAVARNVAIDLAQGDYIAFLDSDDIWLPTNWRCKLRVLKTII